MKKIVSHVICALCLSSSVVYADESSDQQADQFMECLSIAEEQRNNDPNPDMKNHWAQFSDIYGANVYMYAGSINYIFDHIQEKFDKWGNMRQMLPTQAVNNLALAVLNKCDKQALEKVASIDNYTTALQAYLKARQQSAPATP
ncbi:hypothetical protein [Agitococcus lubricus]|uniref:Uncharacterized protein n=1 Tax=Agitococcus lubricus TaxID=1077255 RepID=A0A2T5J476_9GAMM|nr:hypothetical protein [Agitococcus lubricus]PTQ91303.1 hypothetical protein C8N29_101376 [Agitococcus lubricus]